MVEQKTEPFDLSRRNFIKGAAVVAAAGAVTSGTLAGCTPSDEAGGDVTVPATEIYAGVCRGNCFGGCLLDLHVREGKLVRTTARDFPDPEYNRICPRGLTHPARIYSAERIQYPMRRTGEKGTGEFERISWEEAIDEICEKWQAYAQEFGASSIAMVQASGQFATCSGVGFGGAGGRFAAVLGMSSIASNVDAAQGFSATKLAGGMTPGQANNEPTDYKNSKTIICWGSNPMISQQHLVHFIMKAKENGTKYVVIDPVYSINSARADLYIPIEPSTDGALALAILNVIISEGKEDKEFLRAHSEAPLLIKADGMFLRMSDLGVEPTEGPVSATTGKPTVVDPLVVWDEATNTAVALGETQSPAMTGVGSVGDIAVQTVWDNVIEQTSKWTPEVASETCGVSVENIKELARIYLEEGPVNTYTQLGTDHYINGHYNYWPMYAVSVATGNVGKPGAALGPLCVLPLQVMNFLPSAMPTDSEGNMAQGSGTSYTMNSVNDILDTGKFGQKDATLKSIYVMCTNTATTMADHTKTDRWLKKVEFVVVADTSMTETALYADILLPVAHWFEQVDLFTSCHTHPYLVWQDKAIEPQFEAKSDFDIYKLIAEKMGYGAFFDITEEDYINMWLDNEGAKAMNITIDRLKTEKAVRFMPGETFVSFEGGNFLTATGRASFYKETVAPAYDVGQPIDFAKEKVLYWEPALEADKSSPAREKYPFHLISEHMRTRTHSQWWDVGYMDDYEPDPVVRINPADADVLGIEEGDTVRLFNDRGDVTMKATLSSGYPQGIVGSPRSFHAKEFIAGHFANLSTNQYNQVCANQAFNDVAVAIEKV